MGTWSLTESGLPSEMTPDRIKLFVHLHRFETWFRELVYVEMKARFGSLWWTECQAALKRSNAGGIAADRALRGDRRHPHMATPENDPLWFISFDALLKVVFDRKLWKLFAPYLTTKQLVRAKLSELMPVRHRIAHARALHPEDLKRVVAVLSDLDQGFWRFCTSYNDTRPFIERHQKDPVFRNLLGRMFGGYIKLPTGKWAYAANRIGADMDASVDIIVRPSARELGYSSSKLAGRRGVLYSVSFSVAHTRYRFKSDEIIRATQADHDKIVHIVLDGDELVLRITLPALLGEHELNRLIDRFYQVCDNARTPVPRLERRTGSDESGRANRSAQKQIMRDLADEWPHYIVAPDSPLAFLGPDCPCRFFDV